jgi:hypothetical protein
MQTIFQKSELRVLRGKKSSHHEAHEAPEEGSEGRE